MWSKVRGNPPGLSLAGTPGLALRVPHHYSIVLSFSSSMAGGMKRNLRRGKLESLGGAKVNLQRMLLGKMGFVCCHLDRESQSLACPAQSPGTSLQWCLSADSRTVGAAHPWHSLYLTTEEWWSQGLTPLCLLISYSPVRRTRYSRM